MRETYQPPTTSPAGPSHDHTHPHHSRTHPRHSRTHPRHSRVGGNPPRCVHTPGETALLPTSTEIDTIRQNPTKFYRNSCARTRARGGGVSFPSHHSPQRRPVHNHRGYEDNQFYPPPTSQTIYAWKEIPSKTAIDIFSMMAIYSCTSQGAPIVVDGERSPINQIFLAALASPSIHPSPIHGFVPFRCALPGAVLSRHPACGSRDPRTERL